ncbi:isocitrate/isopropylmalate dehydrogenase family protein [Nostoc sp. 'Peltigera malacea cyanobiont' DB3992]|uniref:isocitrate/isopropylmalate dehydrogenase family protein n=1 Tax=Nostoc sp. 'Peltigera malacea cyanobiont' DB3992 TaxID=1206980 RepID=UPI000C03A8F9|nr:isocitrate/isopropylmalate family dehydrogenase [Nostoc sp. 'Peltigera malacea cyanobiont' DB3992]PHM10599.1 3-isopropylmalate dehydrogenase [Nostoc sp. 'Peltigera malacea cyanobiont' DB3992]
MELLILPGDGIGPEITATVISCIEALDRRFSLNLQLQVEEVGLARLQKNGATMPVDLLERAKDVDGIILGPLSTASYPPAAEGGINISREFRQKLDLFANIRPSIGRTGISKYSQDMNLIIVRENTEGFLADRNMVFGCGEFMPTEDVALAVRKISASASKRIAETAFKLALNRKKKVTVVHKANSLKLSDGLFLREVRRVASSYQDIELNEVFVDAMAALLIRNPEKFDVVLTTNLFGDILSDEAAEISGSLGLAASLNEGVSQAVAQAAHGSAPDISGQDRANPTGLMLSTAMLLEWIGNKHNNLNMLEAASCFKSSIEHVLLNPDTRTVDIGGYLGTAKYGQIVAETISQP